MSQNSLLPNKSTRCLPTHLPQYNKEGSSLHSRPARSLFMCFLNIQSRLGAQESWQSCEQNLVFSTYISNFPHGKFPPCGEVKQQSHHQEGDYNLHEQVLSKAIPSIAQDKISHFQRKEKYYCWKGKKISTTRFLFFTHLSAHRKWQIQLQEDLLKFHFTLWTSKLK